MPTPQAEQLRRSHDTFYHLIQNNPFGVYLVDADFRLREVSLGAQKVFANVRPLLGRDFADVLRTIWTEPFATETVRVFRHTLDTGEPYASPATVERRQDVPYVEAYDWRIDRIALPDGQWGVVCYFYDLSERKQFEAAIRESEERLRLGLEASGTGLWDWDMASNRVKWSERVYAFHGLAPDDFDGSIDRFIQCVHPEDRDRVGRAIQDSVQHRAPYVLEFRVVHPGGEVRWLTTTGKVFYDDHGAPVRMLGATADVTERKKSEAAAWESRAHLAAIVESSDDAIVSKTLEGIIRSWNTGAMRIFGYTAEEAIGRPVLMLLPPDRHHEETAILARLRAGERIDHFESVRVAKDGRHIDVSLTISPVKDGSGRIIGASKVARDITRQKRAERELQAAKEMADAANRSKDELLESERLARAESERASRMKDEFLATLSHELRTPLNAILGWSQILATGREGLDEELAEGLRTIERNARAQTQIIEDLLDMSRIISGKIRLDVQRLDVAGVVRAAVETARPAADAKGIRVRAVLDSVAGPISGDPNRLQQVFWNLLTNAVKFTPRGGQVQVLLERINSHVEISVIDTGEGIAPEFLPHVFDRFRQADASTTRRHGGLGLGLAIVKQLVELHGGTARVRSGGQGLGSTFTIALPLTVIHPGPETSEERRHPGRGPVPMLDDTCVKIAGLKVLVVDDEPDARALVRRLLEDCEAVVTTAASAEEGLERLHADRPHVLVSDIGMPGEDGYSLIRRVRELPPERGGRTPAVALTAYARAEDRMKAVMAGFDMHIVKPVEPAELITMIAALGKRLGE